MTKIRLRLTSAMQRIVDAKLIVCVLAMILGSCATTRDQICGGWTSWVEPSRAEYFATNRIYDLDSDIRELALRFKPELVIHPLGKAPIDFDDYLDGIDLVYAQGDNKGEVIENVAPEVLSNMDYDTMCDTYLRQDKEEVVSEPPYPWYVQAYRSPAPHDEDEEWLYLKYNIVFDWSGLAAELSSMARAGARILTSDLGKWHRLDVHTNVVIAIDPEGRQRLATVSQHNYAKTYLAGRDFDPNQPIQMAAAYRSNELYIDGEDSDSATADTGKRRARTINDDDAQGQRYRVITFMQRLPYLISGNKPPNYHGRDIVVTRNDGGVPVETRVDFIAADAPVAAYAGLLAPPERLFGSIYVGRDGPMGYDYYAPREFFRLERLAALGYWQYGDEELAADIAQIIDEEEWDWRDTTAMEKMMELMKEDLQEDLQNGICQPDFTYC